MSDLKAKLISLAKNKAFRALVADYANGKISVKIGDTVLSGIPLLAGTVAIGDIVKIDFSSGSPIATAEPRPFPQAVKAAAPSTKQAAPVHTTAKGLQDYISANEIAFSASLSTNQSLSANFFTVIAFDTKRFDQGSYFDVATHRWTPPAGKVFVHGLAWLASVGNGRGQITIFKNGRSQVSASPAYIDASQKSVEISGVFEANGADYFELAISDWVGTNTILATSDAATLTIFDGFVIGSSDSHSAIPLLAADPPAPSDGDVWILKTGGDSNNGSPIGLLLALTQTSASSAAYDLSLYDQGTIKRIRFT
jgi:hypothetical protein